VSASLKLLHSSNPLQISITGEPVVEASCHYRSFSILALVVEVGDYRLVFRLPFNFCF